MIEYELDRKRRVLCVRPTQALSKEDFDELARIVDPFIEETGGLAGLAIVVSHFPGWENLGGMIRHFCFVRDHHTKIRRVALVTDSRLGDIAEHIASHFVAAEIKHFPAGDQDAALDWVAEEAKP